MLKFTGMPHTTAQGDLFSARNARGAEVDTHVHDSACMYLSLYLLDNYDCRRLRLTDAYSAYLIIASLFNFAGDAKKQHDFLFADLGIKNHRRQFMIFSQDEPEQPQIGVLNTIILPSDYWAAGMYKFQIVINPVIRCSDTGANESICDAGVAGEWFMRKAPGWGFEVIPETLQVSPMQTEQFVKDGSTVTLNKASISGWLRVTNKMLFAQSARDGIGSGKSYGCGLLQIAPADLPEDE